MPSTSNRLRLGIVATHPIQYYAPLYRELTSRPQLAVTVMFARQPTPIEQGEGFGVPFTWDIDLTAGYEYRWLHDEASSARGNGRAGDRTPQLASWILERRFDAVLVHGWHARVYWRAMRACWASRTPVYVRGDSQLGNDSGRLKRTAKRAFYPWFMRRYAACLSVGHRSEQYFRYYGARRVVRSPHFVDNGAFAAGADRVVASARASFNLGAEDLVVLFAGKLVAFKRVTDLIAAAGRAADPRVVLLIVGDGADRQTCERAAAAAGVRAVFAGFLNQSEMPRAYAAADVLVLPSSASETWGLVVNEAMACSRPAFVSDAVGCAPDLIVPGRTGDRFSPGDVDRLAALLGSSDRGQLAAMGAAARAHITGFSATAAVNGVLQAIEGS